MLGVHCAADNLEIDMNCRLFALFVVLIPTWLAAETPPEQKTLAPYFVVNGAEEDSTRFPLKNTNVDVNVAGVIAQVVLTQTYKNDSAQAIEARYVFPGSTRAAVSAMKMKIGERVVFAEIKEKEAAKATYESAKKEGKTASLLEQHRANVFEMNVANIMPQQEVLVTLTYDELLVPTAGIYQFVFPAVVGPRYSEKSASSTDTDDTWVQNPYLKEGQPTPTQFDLQVHLNAGMPIQDISSPSHKIAVEFSQKQSAVARLAEVNSSNGNRDFIMNYRLAGAAIQTGVLLFEGQDENFFAAMLEPPTGVKAAEIPPRDYIFVVDVSGSMNGFPIATAKKLMADLLTGLKTSDSFNLLLFAGAADEFSSTSVPATSDNIARAIAMLERQSGGGATRLLPALEQAIAYPLDENRSRTIVVVTDGYVDVETATFELIKKNLGNANVFAFGIGSSVNRLLIEGMAHAGKGESYVVTNSSSAPAQAQQFREFVSAPLLTKIRAKFEGFDVYDLEPKEIPDVFAKRPVIVVGKYRGAARGTIRLEGFVGKGKFETTLDLSNYVATPQNSALRSLWARETIRLLGDYYAVSPNDERKRTITQLGLKYSLLTQFTSFIAVDQEIRRKQSESLKSVQQPLPLPAEVSNFAVGGAGFIPTAPEPETWALILVGLFVVIWVRFGHRLLGTEES